MFQSLAFIAIGMMIAEKEKQGEIKDILKKGKVLISLYVAKIPISLIGGDLSQVLDLSIFYGLFALIIFENQELNLQGKFYKMFRDFSGMIYYTHMYLVALCALVLNKDGYHNPISFLYVQEVQHLLR